MIAVWVIVFVASLFALVKGADWLLSSGEKIGLRLGMSSFVVGVLIVGIGTSLPELISSLAAVFNGVTDIVVANASGSNIANILLIVGVSAILAKKLEVTKDLIDSELPVLAVATVLFLGAVYDGTVTFVESLILVAGYLVYLFYTLDGEGDETSKKIDLIPDIKPKIYTKDYVMLFAGVAGLALGAKYLIDSVVALSSILDVAPGVISITAVAIGTSLPELLVSAKAALNGKAEVAIGNIFGSNAFNVLMVVGIPGIITTLHVDTQTLSIGVPMVLIATFLFIVSAISRRIYRWEGMMFLLLYLLFTLKLFALI